MMATWYDSHLNTPSRNPATSDNATTNEASPDASSPQRPTKRQKVTRACDSCKTRKRRCNGEIPCSSCWWVVLSRVGLRSTDVGRSNGGKCTYNATYTRGRVVPPTPSIHAPDIADKPAVPTVQQTSGPLANGLNTSLEPPEDLSSNLRLSRAGSPDQEPATLAGQYSGPSSAYSFLRRAWKRLGLDANQPDEGEPHQAGVPIFNFGDKFIPKDLEALSAFHLPSRSETQELFVTYFDFAMPTYRYLHQPTVAQWLDTYHDQLEGKEGAFLLPSRQAIVLMVLATASLFTSETHGEEPWRVSEPYFQVAQAKLGSETGKARLESVQARIAICLYLLHTSRPNQSWYTFGITCQLMMSIGMHRDRPKTAPQSDPVTSECRRRAFWAAYTIDFYLSVMLGRPHMIHDDHSDQRIFLAVDDEEISAEGLRPISSLQKDRVIQASMYHAKITRIVKVSIRTQYALSNQSNERKQQIATQLNDELAAWKASLPALLSGAVHPSSLIQIYQRQMTVLRLAHAHAEMLVNRPLMLLDASPSLDITPHILRCLEGAKTTIDTILQYVSDRRMFSLFWHSQYVTFNALSIIYVWLIQRKRGRMAHVAPPFASDADLFQLAETTQDHFAAATRHNAPCTRFSIILEELQAEASRLMGRTKGARQRPPQLQALSDASPEGQSYARPARRPETATETWSERADSMSWESLGADFPLDPDLWLQLDSFPFCKLPETRGEVMLALY